MDPGKPIRMVFPFGANIVFKPNSDQLYKFSEDAIKNNLIPEVAVAMEKYAGRHFTICFHAATNLQRGDVPDRRDLEQIEDKASQALKDTKGQLDSQEVTKLLDKRLTKMKDLLGEPLKKAVKEKVRFMEHDLTNGKEKPTQKEIDKADITVVDIPGPSTDTRHFSDANDALMPSGAVIVLAEEKHEQFWTQEHLFGDTKAFQPNVDGCKMSSSDKWKATRHYRHDFNPDALPMSETALFFNGLPESRHDEWDGKQSRITGAGRLTGDEVSKLVASGDDRTAPLQAVLKQATEEKDKLLKAAGIKHK